WPVIWIGRLSDEGRNPRSAARITWGFKGSGALDRIRTCDPCLRRAVLYPTELRVRKRGMIPSDCPFVHALSSNSVAAVGGEGAASCRWNGLQFCPMPLWQYTCRIVRALHLGAYQ